MKQMSFLSRLANRFVDHLGNEFADAKSAREEGNYMSKEELQRKIQSGASSTSKKTGYAQAYKERFGERK